jgi:hypothetical protein
MTARRARPRAVPEGPAKPAPSLDKGEFPALTAFLRGYLHEDFVEEHGSAREAAAAFCRDASPEERRRLAEQIARLVEAARGLPPTALRRFVTRDLGSGWAPQSAADLADLLKVIRTEIG